MSFEELLKSLRADYLDSLPGKIDIILNQIHATALDDLRESFHKLKGTGTTYGLPEVSELAEVLEDICTDRPTDAPRAALRATELLREIHQAHSNDRAFDLSADARFTEVRDLLLPRA